jgi:hypothetical protein
MDLDKMLFLQIVNEAMYPNDEIYKKYDEADWETLFRVSRNNCMEAFVYKVVQKLSLEYAISIKLVKFWKIAAMTCQMHEFEKHRILRTLLKEAEKQEVILVIFKGLVIADLYPNYSYRFSSDTDIFVYESDKEKVIQLFESFGFKKDEQYSKAMVGTYVYPEFQYVVELHFSLFEDYKGARINKLNNLDLTKKGTLLSIQACGMEVTTLGYEEHLIYQMFHIIKHFSLQGVGVRYLVDITYYINNYIEKIDIESFWRKMDYLDYTTFCRIFFKICIDYFDMDQTIMADRNVADVEGLSEFLLDIINVGTIYDEKDAAWQILGIMTPYFTGEDRIPKTNFGIKMKVLFPSSKALPINYAYAKKCKLLLPVAWSHKFINFTIKRHNHKGDWYEAGEKLAVAQHRLNLMKSLGLMDGGK